MVFLLLILTVLSIFLVYSTATIRFHPTVRLHLAAASYLGAVAIHDIQAKKRVFLAKSAHKEPCRDIAMCANTPNVLMSCSYDCNVNIYDIRKKQLASQVVQQHPLQCVTLSPCGAYMCTGDLKGHIGLYDLRNSKEALATKLVHNDGVVRIGFVPVLSAVNNSSRGNIKSYKNIRM